MSSKFLERLDEIREGAPPRLGFGPSRGEKTPGMALVIDIGDKSSDLESAVALAPAAIIISSRYRGKAPGQDAEAMSLTAKVAGNRNIPWGGRTGSLSAADAEALRKAGGDLVVFSEKTKLDAAVSRDLARILTLDTPMSAEDLRDINPLPIDAVLITIPGNPAQWTLQTLTAVTRIPARVGKHVLAEIPPPPKSCQPESPPPAPPSPGAHEALRDAGIAGLVVDLSIGETAIAQLKTDLLNIPRPGANRRSRPSAILPGSVYAPRRPAPPDDPDDDDDD